MMRKPGRMLRRHVSPRILQRIDRSLPRDVQIAVLDAMPPVAHGFNTRRECVSDGRDWQFNRRDGPLAILSPPTDQPLKLPGRSVSRLAVYEPPQPTAGRRRRFHALPKLPLSLAAWQARASAPCVTPSLLDAGVTAVVLRPLSAVRTCHVSTAIGPVVWQRQRRWRAQARSSAASTWTYCRIASRVPQEFTLTPVPPIMGSSSSRTRRPKPMNLMRYRSNTDGG
jgi:hypothetical protein